MIPPMPALPLKTNGRNAAFEERDMFNRQSERVAQAVEHVTFNHGVEGSSPSALTKQNQ